MASMANFRRKQLSIIVTNLTRYSVNYVK